MSILSKTINVVQPYQSERLNSPAIISIPPQHWAGFQELVQRGSNLWPDASPEIKEFADRVTVGRVQQDYYSQANVPSPVPTLQLKDKIMIDPEMMQAQAINLQEDYSNQLDKIPVRVAETSKMFATKQVQAPVWSFANAIAAFNSMYKMPSNEHDNVAASAARLRQFKKMILDEVSEIDLILEKLDNPDSSNGYPQKLNFMTDLADLLGDIQVFCASEMKRFNIPIDATLRIIMDSNFSKLQADGTALFVDGKLQKGPNYWKPEPMIEEMLKLWYGQV